MPTFAGSRLAQLSTAAIGSTDLRNRRIILLLWVAAATLFSLTYNEEAAQSHC